MALVTIVIPTYDRQDYLQKAVQSVLSQTFQDYEVVIADDAGPLKLAALIAEIDDKRFSLLRRKTNIGAGKNIWSALADANSPFVITLNDDDLWHPRLLESLVHGLLNYPTASVAFCNILCIDAYDRPLHELTDNVNRKYGRTSLKDGFHIPFIYEGVWTGTIPAAMGALFRHSNVQWTNFPDEVGTYYDEWLAYITVRDGSGVFYCSEQLSLYRVHDGSETAAGGFSEKARLRQRCQAEYISRAKLADPVLKMCHKELRHKNKRALVGVVNSSILANQREIGWQRLAAARPFHSLAFIASLQLALLMPTQLSKIALKMKRLIIVN